MVINSDDSQVSEQNTDLSIDINHPDDLQDYPHTNPKNTSIFIKDRVSKQEDDSDDCLKSILDPIKDEDYVRKRTILNLNIKKRKKKIIKK